MLVASIFKRELASYFSTPLASIFIIIFVALNGVFTFYMGHFFERGQADLASFFGFHPWLYLILVPAIAMRLWAEERQQGTSIILLTAPIQDRNIILGKFFGALGFLSIITLCTIYMPLLIQVNGKVSIGQIVAGYLGLFCLANSKDSKSESYPL